MVAFEWNEEKRQATLLKHGIDFIDAVEVLTSDHLSVDARSEAEQRKLAIGRLNGIAIAVVYTMRGDICRIITARRARRDEREHFEALFSGRDQKTEKPD